MLARSKFIRIDFNPALVSWLRPPGNGAEPQEDSMIRLSSLTPWLMAAALAVAAPAAAQTPPNVLVVGQIAEPGSLDPHVSTAANDFRIVRNIFDGLVRNKPGTLEIEPALATD